MRDSSLYQAQCSALVIAAGALGIVVLYRRLLPGRDLIGVLPLALAALGVRALIVLTVSQMGEFGTTIRGPDDPAFFQSAELLAAHDWSSAAWTTALKGDGLTLISSAVLKLLADPGADSLRLLQCVIASFAVLLLMVAVHDFAGRGAALATGALLLLEPSSLFFTTILQKESLLLLAVSLAAFAAARLWQDDLHRAIPSAFAGLAVAAIVRPYAGGFLAAGLVLCGLHWSVVRAGPRRTIVLAALVGVTIAAGALFVGSGAAGSSLHRLQEFQRLETHGSSALRLEPVDFTTIDGATKALPQRLVDFAFRPLPWQVANTEQRFGAAGTLIAWGLAMWVIAGLALTRRRARPSALIYLAAAVTVGYAVTSANAGTGFRHRLHLLVLLVAIGSVWWAYTSSGQRLGIALSRLWARRGRRQPRSGTQTPAAGSVSVAARYLIVGLLNLVGSVYLIRTLGPEIWATYTVAFFIAAFFDQQVGTKVLGAIINHPDGLTGRQVGAVAIVSLTAGALILVVLLIVRGPLADATQLPGLAACLAAAGGCALVLAVRAPAAAILERELRFGWIAVAEVLDQVTFFGVAIPFALSGEPINGLALGLLLRGVPGALMLLVLAGPRVALPHRQDVRAATAFGVPVLGVALLALIEGLTPFALLGPDDPRALGWVNTAASLVGYAAVVMLVMQRVGFASISDLRRRTGSVATQTRHLAESVGLLLLIMLAPTALAAHWIPTLLGAAWSGAGVTFAAIGIGYLFMGPITVGFGTLYASGRPWLVVACYVVMTVTYGGLLVVEMLPQTASGVAVAYAISRAAGLATMVSLLFASDRDCAPLGAVAGVVAGAAGLATVTWWTDGGPAFGALAGALLTAAAIGWLTARQAGWLRQQARSLGA